MSELEKIFCNYQNDKERGGDSTEVVEARNKLYVFVRNETYLPDKTIGNLEEHIELLAGENERQGFINGFKYAIQILKECLN